MKRYNPFIFFIYAAGVFSITLTFMSCADTPWTGSIVTPTMDDYLTVTGDGDLCFENGVGSSCVKLIPQGPQDPLNPRPHIHLYTGRTVYVFYRDGVPVVRAIRSSTVSGETPVGLQAPTSSVFAAATEEPEPVIDNTAPVFDTTGTGQLEPVVDSTPPPIVNPAVVVNSPDPAPVTDPVTTPITTPITDPVPDPVPDPVTDPVTTNNNDGKNRWIIEIQGFTLGEPGTNTLDLEAYCESITITDENGNTYEKDRVSLLHGHRGDDDGIQMIFYTDAEELTITEAECGDDPVTYTIR